MWKFIFCFYQNVESSMFVSSRLPLTIISFFLFPNLGASATSGSSAGTTTTSEGAINGNRQDAARTQGSNPPGNPAGTRYSSMVLSGGSKPCPKCFPACSSEGSSCRTQPVSLLSRFSDSSGQWSSTKFNTFQDGALTILSMKNG